MVAIVSPLQNQVLSGGRIITVSATDDLSVPSVSIFFEGMEAYPSQLSEPPYRLQFDTRTIPNGMQVIRADAVDDAGNQSAHRVAVLIANPMPPPAAPGLVIADDLNGDGRYTGQDLKIALARCVPGCTLRALARTYDDVEVAIPAAITNPLIIEGAGMGRTVFRSPVPWQQPMITVSYPNPLVTIRDLTIDGRKEEQISSLVTTQGQVGIQVTNPWARDSGPGVIERVEVRNMLNAGVGIGEGRGWIVRYNRIHDNGCSTRFPCPNLRSIDPGAPRHDPSWQSIGYGVVIESSDVTVHNNQLWNINKIGIEAFEDPAGVRSSSQPMSGFHFHHNHVQNAGSGIGSNSGSGGLIESNTVAYSTGHGIFCGGPAGDLVFENNLVSDSGLAGLWVSCWGANITVSNNRIGNSCRRIPGGGSGLLVDAGTQFGGGGGLDIEGNTVIEPFCQSANLVSFRDDVRMSGNDFRGGNMATVIFQDASRIEMSDSWIDGQNRVPTDIFLLQNVDGLTVRRDVSMSGYTQRPVTVRDPASVTNLVLE